MVAVGYVEKDATIYVNECALGVAQKASLIGGGHCKRELTILLRGVISMSLFFSLLIDFRVEIGN